MSKRKAQLWLAGVWLAGALLLGMIMVYETIISSALQGFEQEAWKWLSNAVVPNATLMLGVLAAQAFSVKRDMQAPRSLFTIALVASLLYLTVVTIVLVMIPLRFSIQPLRLAEWPLDFFQAINSLLLGIFFATEHSKGPAHVAAGA